MYFKTNKCYARSLKQITQKVRSRKLKRLVERLEEAMAMAAVGLPTKRIKKIQLVRATVYLDEKSNSLAISVIEK